MLEAPDGLHINTALPRRQSRQWSPMLQEKVAGAEASLTRERFSRVSPRRCDEDIRQRTQLKTRKWASRCGNVGENACVPVAELDT